MSFACSRARYLPDNGAEAFSALRKVAESVKTGAGRREQDRIAGDRLPAGGFHRLVPVRYHAHRKRRRAEIRTDVQCRPDLFPRLAGQDDRRRPGTQRLRQRCKGQVLILPAADDGRFAHRVSRRLLQELGREPTPEEIAREMGISEERVREIQKIAQDPVSLETPIGEEDDSHLGDFIEDDNATAPSDVAAFTMLKEQLIGVLDTLTPREEKVLRLRYGIDDGRPRTLEEVGKEFNVTRERIRQIEAKALRKLRHPSRSKKLKDFLE